MSYDQVEGTLSTGEVTKQASRGLVALLLRQVLYYGAIFFGNIFLARALTSEAYGIFAATLALQATLTVVSDMGLGAALIQREQKPTQSELASLFTLQICLYSLVAAGLWLAAPWIVGQARQDAAAVPVARALGVVFLITALRSIPAILLERELRFDVIALAEVLGMVVYQCLVVGLVWSGYGFSSIVWALAARYSLDLFVILWNQPWRPKLSLRFVLILPYIRFGLGLQGVRILSYVKDQLPLLLLIPVIGASGGGTWGWSLSYIGIPVYFSRLVDRLVFPIYSRVQQSATALGEIASVAIWLNFSVGLPLLLLLLLFAEPLITTVYGVNWLHALPVVYLLAPNMLGGFITGSLFPVLFAKGQTGNAFRIIFWWVMLTLVGVAVGLIVAQLAGMALAYSLATLIVCVILLRETALLAPFDLFKTVRGPFMALAIAVAFAWLVLAQGLPWLAAAFATVLVFGLALLAIDYRRLTALLRAAA